MADTDDVGGPEEKMDRFGVLKREECGTPAVGAARSSSGTGLGSARGVARREKKEGVAEVSANRGEGESLVIVGGKDQVGSWACGSELTWEEEGMFRSDMSPCKACDETSGSSDSDIFDSRIQGRGSAVECSCNGCVGLDPARSALSAKLLAADSKVECQAS